jgi:hypothetical protein
LKRLKNLQFFEIHGCWMNAWLPVSADASDALVASFIRAFKWRSLSKPVKRGGRISL